MIFLPIFFHLLLETCYPFTHILQDCYTGTGINIWLFLLQWNEAGAHFVNDFAIIIQIQWKIVCVAIKFVTAISM